MDWFKTGTAVHQSCMLLSYLFNLNTEYIMRNARLDEAQARIKIARRNINNLRYADDTTLVAESKEELINLLTNVEEKSWKSWLKTQHSKNKDHGICSHHFMSNRWGKSGNSIGLHFLVFQNHRIWWLQPHKRYLLLGRKAVRNPNSALKSRDINLPTKFHIIKAMIFPAVTYGCESWTIKKAEHWRIDTFKLWF